MIKGNILVVEDEAITSTLIQKQLEFDGFNVYRASSGEEAIRLGELYLPDLILLDLVLPGIDGFEVCKRLKSNSKTSKIPIIILTSKYESEDIVNGLNCGADDYITKPYDREIFLARINAVLRRVSQSFSDKNTIIKIEELIIDSGRYEVLLSDRKIDLTVTEFKTLYFLASQRGWVFTRDQIIEAIKGDDHIVTDRTVDVLIAGLRKKLGNFENYIETVRGVGYRFKED